MAVCAHDTNDAAFVRYARLRRGVDGHDDLRELRQLRVGVTELFARNEAARPRYEFGWNCASTANVPISRS